jgi:hypothetical protein
MNRIAMIASPRRMSMLVSRDARSGAAAVVIAAALMNAPPSDVHLA